ncbi:clathrin light chain isoform X1 [Cimex lectularius]|uniref:Clathrin light chain n=1 Tax=Cimex lectularius TaxID=79782 RepID=A0A8I6RXR6_CIMLE|nr:clathrin light chain isoform X1 [Cimex lectularius]
MEDFGDRFDESEVDPAAEFLAREQNQLAGLEDELRPATVINGPDGDLGQIVNADGINSVGQPELNGPMNGGGDSERSALYAEDDIRTTSPTPVKQPPREEPEKIKKWREDQKKMLEEKDRNEEIKKEEWRESAKKELEDWYKHQEDLLAKTRSANRNAEKQFVADAGAIEPGTEWERIAKLCDFNPKSSRTSKDVSRMRSIILQLKQTSITKQA